MGVQGQQMTPGLGQTQYNQQVSGFRSVYCSCWTLLTACSLRFYDRVFRCYWRSSSTWIVSILSMATIRWLLLSFTLFSYRHFYSERYLWIVGAPREYSVNFKEIGWGKQPAGLTVCDVIAKSSLQLKFIPSLKRVLGEDRVSIVSPWIVNRIQFNFAKEEKLVFSSFWS